MLLKIAWRNIWRSRTRSIVIIIAVSLAVWATIALLSFSFGFVKSYVDNAVEHNTSHLQVHDSLYLENNEVQYYMNFNDTRFDEIMQIPEVKAGAYRSIVLGMVGNSKGSRGLQIKGVAPQLEDSLTGLSGMITAGDYFSSKGKNQILIGSKLAKKMGVKLRSKVVLTFQNLNGDMTAGAFRVKGFYSTKNDFNDNAIVFVKRSDLNRLLGNDAVVHEMAFLLKNQKDLSTVQSKIQRLLPEEKVSTYREISPDVNLYETQMLSNVNIFIAIVMLALVFGLINTMLMAVLERYRELGVLMAVGMNRLRVFGMIFYETIMLTTVAAIPGLIAGWLTVMYFGNYGLDLSAFSSGMEKFGLASIVYPTLEGEIYFRMALAVWITAVVASVYPAWKAVRLRPVEAIRKL